MRSFLTLKNNTMQTNTVTYHRYIYVVYTNYEIFVISIDTDSQRRLLNKYLKFCDNHGSFTLFMST